MKNKKGSGEIAIFLFMLVFIVAVLVCIAGIDSVPAGHIGVKERFGVIDDTPWGPGYQWTGIFTSTIDFSTRIQLEEYDVSAFSSDAQVVETQVALNFRIDPVRAPEIYKNIGRNYQDVIISPIIQETVKANTAKYPLDDLVKNRGEVKNAITNALIQKLQDKGLIVTEVALTNFEFSPEVQAAIEAKQVAAQDALAAQNNLKAMEYNAKAMTLQKDLIEIKKLDLELQKIAVDKIRAEAWDGVMPTTVVMTNGESNMLLGLNSL